MTDLSESQNTWMASIRTIDQLAARIGEVITESSVFKEWEPEDRTFMVMDALFKSLRKYAGERNRMYGGPMSVHIDAPPIIGDTRDPDVAVHIEENMHDRRDWFDIITESFPDIALLHENVPPETDGMCEVFYHTSRWRRDGTYAQLEVRDYGGAHKRGVIIRKKEHPARKRLHMLLESTRIRHQGTLARSERVAFRKLKKMLDPLQRECLEVDGSFFEKSPRSHVSYLLRKNRPTLALKISEDGKCVRPLAALCLHPFGYHDGTFTGVMAPSDEMIAHLLYIRGDEHGYWRDANHIPITSTRSGV